ncbi:MAG: winged helix-turn-helix transcriptional regulator [Actinobacteria bacterium]|nr:winged helix-turn-helix transcriptional regulator [Actinomycetota bacterium]MBI3686769.1 winged helix-turn-helix transcriptional regulator [Actinomycetota bacterium]
MEPISGPDSARIDLVSVLGALADPVRLAYVQALAEAEQWMRCGEVLQDSGKAVAKSTLSHHLRVLREAGLTYTRVDGARRYVSLRRDDLDKQFPGLLDAVCKRPRES